MSDYPVSPKPLHQLRILAKDALTNPSNFCEAVGE
ncbi:hypothetical protein AK812_SmicGene47693, partial [Symbiodinium microadriaticum]